MPTKSYYVKTPSVLRTHVMKQHMDYVVAKEGKTRTVSSISVLLRTHQPPLPGLQQRVPRLPPPPHTARSGGCGCYQSSSTGKHAQQFPLELYLQLEYYNVRLCEVAWLEDLTSYKTY